MQLKETNKILNTFGKYVVQQARTILSKNKNKKGKGFTRNNTKGLYNSLAYFIDETRLGSRIYFEMEDYGMFQDRGVSGTERKYNTPFSYTNKMPPIDALSKWAKFNNIRLRDEKGKFKKGNYRTIGYLIARSIKKKGIKPSLFFTKPFEKSFVNLPKELQNTFAIDLDNFLTINQDRI